MTVKEIWAAYVAAVPCRIDTEYEAWSCGGSDPDLLAQLTASGRKTATSSLYSLYEYENCELPKEGCHNVITKTDGEAVCIAVTKRVTVVPFRQVSAEHARREGEGDGSLRYWMTEHSRFFTEEAASIGRKFTEDDLIVCEEFQVVYPRPSAIAPLAAKE